MRLMSLVAATLIVAGLMMVGAAVMSAPGDPGACDRHPEDPRCVTSTTSSTTSTSPTTTPTTTTDPPTTTTRPPSPGGIVGPVSCSNGRQSFQGYTAVSTVDRLAPITGMEQGGWTVGRATDPSDPKYAEGWAVYNKYRPSTGYDHVGPILCLHNSEHNGVLDDDLKVLGEELIAEIQSRDPNATIYVMGLNLYPAGHVCPLAGPNGDIVANSLADYLADLSPTDNIVRGPILGPLTTQMITGGNDQCHLTSAGRLFVGNQLAAYFD